MAKKKSLILVCLFIIGATGFSIPNRAYAGPCDAIVGKWAWFIGGEVTVSPDGTFVQQSGNAGTWECTDAARGRFTFRWRDGGFVNSLAVTPDGQGLTSTDLSQSYVTAQRSGPAPSSQSQLVQKGDCCREEYTCEIKRIEAQFEQKLATCHYPGNAACNAEAVSAKASGLKAAGEKLRLCNRTTGNQVPSGGLSARDLPFPSASSDEFNSTERTENFSQGCQPCKVITSGREAATPESEPKPYKLSTEVRDITREDAKRILGEGKSNDWDPFFQAVFNAIDRSWKRVSTGMPDFVDPVAAKYNITLSPGQDPIITDIEVQEGPSAEKIADALQNTSLTGIKPPSYEVRKITYERSTFKVRSFSDGVSQQDQSHFIEVDGKIRRYLGAKIPGAIKPKTRNY